MNNTDTNITSLIAINDTIVQYVRGSTMRPSYNGTADFTRNDPSFQDIMIFIGSFFGVLLCGIYCIIRRDPSYY